MKTNQEYMNEWLKEIQFVNKLATKTIQMYKLRINEFNTLIEEKSLSEVKRSDIIDYLSNENESIGTKEQKQTVVRVFYNWMCDNDYVTKHPMMNAIKFANEERNPEFLEKEQWETIREYLKNQLSNEFKVYSSNSKKRNIKADNMTEARRIFANKYEKGHITYVQAEVNSSSFTKERNHMVMYFMINSGLRAQETLNLKVENISFDRQEVTVIGKRNKERIVIINAFVTRALKEYIENNELTGYVFPNAKKSKWSKSSMDVVFDNVSKATGINVHCHLLRHSFAQNEYDRGVKLEIIQQQMGHSSITTTQIYAKVRSQQVKDAVNQ